MSHFYTEGDRYNLSISNKDIKKDEKSSFFKLFYAR